MKTKKNFTPRSIAHLRPLLIAVVMAGVAILAVSTFAANGPRTPFDPRSTIRIAGEKHVSCRPVQRTQNCVPTGTGGVKTYWNSTIKYSVPTKKAGDYRLRITYRSVDGTPPPGYKFKLHIRGNADARQAELPASPELKTYDGVVKLKGGGSPLSIRWSNDIYTAGGHDTNLAIARLELVRVPDPPAPKKAKDNCGKLSGSPKQIIDSKVVPVAHEIGFKNYTVGSITAANHRHGATVSGSRSDHQGPPNRAWAADLSNSSHPTPEMDRLAADLAKCFGLKWNGSGIVNRYKDGYRIQMIYRSSVGGNHFNHVHIGIRRV